MNSFRREDVQKYFDEVTHVELPAKLVKEARAEELEYFNTLPVWKVVKTQECWDTTGSPPISTKWVDVNKGDQQDYDIRCRLVAREMGGGKSDEFYAPTPPLEAKRLLFSEAATNRRFGKHEKKLLFIDVRTRLIDPRLSNCLPRCSGPAIAVGSSDACTAPRVPR